MGDGPISEQPLPSSFDEDITKVPTMQRFFNKLKAEPLIPLGCVLTVTALVNAGRAMRRGNHTQVQRMFRMRVAAQGFTVLAIVGGGMYYGQERSKERELWQVEQAQKNEEKRMRWIQELEARDAEEKALQAKLAQRRERREAKQAAAAAAGTDGTQDAKAGSPILSSLSMGWLGGSKPSNDAAPSDDAAATAAVSSEGESGERNNTKGTSSLSVLGGLYSKKGSGAADGKTDETK